MLPEASRSVCGDPETAVIGTRTFLLPIRHLKERLDKHLHSLYNVTSQSIHESLEVHVNVVPPAHNTAPTPTTNSHLTKKLAESCDGSQGRME